MNHRSDSEPRMYRIECPNGHEKELCPSSFESFITSGEHDCEKCDEPLSFGDGSIDLECHVCQDVFNVSGPEEAMHTIDHGCGACERREFDGQSIHVPDSYQCWDAEYEWMRSGKDAKPLVRETRKDYWEGVIHFCSAAEFASISREGKIRASPTGYFKVPAVCLTEATESGWGELSKRHGEFGFVFRKSDLIRVGGGPALYLSEDRIKAQRWHNDIKPLVNLLRIPSASPGSKKWDFLHEREWRTPRDIVFKETEPFAVIAGQFGRDTQGWRDIFRALMQYEELYIAPGPSSGDSATPESD